MKGSLIITTDPEENEAAYGYVYTPYNELGWVAEAGTDVIFMENGRLVNTSHLVETSQINILEDGDYEIHYTFVLNEPSDALVSIAVNGEIVTSTTVPILNQAGEFSNSSILTLVAGNIITLHIS